MANIKKFSKENGLSFRGNLAFGLYRGYMLTLRPLSGQTVATFSVSLTDREMAARISAVLQDEENRKTYKIANSSVSKRSVTIVFTDPIGGFMKQAPFLETVANALSLSGAKGISVCSICGEMLDTTSGGAYIINDVAYELHDACAMQYNEQNKERQETERAGGNVFLGAIGALIGGVIGAIPWAIAYAAGWFVGWLGFLIAFAAKKGYELFHGKRCKAKAFIIIAVTIVAVLLAEGAALVLSVHHEIASDPTLSELHLTIADSAEFTRYILENDAEARGSVVSDVVIGLLFAALGMASTVKEVFTDTSSKKNMAQRIG